MKVMNRSTGVAVYSLPELNIRRVFNIGEIKELKEEEIAALYNTDAGRELIKNILQVQNKEYVRQHLWPEAPIEYFWTLEEIKNCIENDSKELFSETLDYAPEGVIDIIKEIAWRGPISDINKAEVLKQKLGFDPLLAHKIMTAGEAEAPAEAKSGQRLRKE